MPPGNAESGNKHAPRRQREASAEVRKAQQFRDRDSLSSLPSRSGPSRSAGRNAQQLRDRNSLRGMRLTPGEVVAHFDRRKAARTTCAQGEIGSPPEP